MLISTAFHHCCLCCRSRCLRSKGRFLSFPHSFAVCSFLCANEHYLFRFIRSCKLDFDRNPSLQGHLGFFDFLSHFVLQLAPNLRNARHRFRGSPTLGLGAAPTQLHHSATPPQQCSAVFMLGLPSIFSFIRFRFVHLCLHFILLCLIHFELFGHSFSHSFIHLFLYAIDWLLACFRDCFLD